MFATMRSNDAYLGLPHDVFAFTMLQEIIARSLNVEVGGYKHAIGSLHLYSSNTEEAQRYIDEGLQARIAMPSMPSGDPWPALNALIRAEQAIRSGRRPSTAKQDPYWADLVRLLRIYRYSRGNRLSNLKAIVSLKNEMQSEVYETYIQKRERQLAPAVQPAEDLLFDPAELDAGMESLSSESDG
jgi:thymidylate synthase